MQPEDGEYVGVAEQTLDRLLILLLNVYNECCQAVPQIMKPRTSDSPSGLLPDCSTPFDRIGFLLAGDQAVFCVLK
jgi:hypothetical protein